MINSQKTSDSKQLDDGERYFKQGFEYLLTGLSQSLQLMGEVDLSGEMSKENVVKMVKQLNTKIDFFCMSHLEGFFEGQDQAVVASSAKKEGIEDPTIKRVKKLESEVSKLRRKNRRSKGGNLRLRRRIQNLQERLIKAKNLVAWFIQKNGEKSRKDTHLERDKESGNFEKNHKQNSHHLHSKELSQKLSSPQDTSKNKMQKSLQETGDFDRALQVTNKIQEKQKTVKDIEIKVSEIRNHRQNGLIGGSETHLAIKNKRSYLIGTDQGGIELIEEVITIYSERLSTEQKDSKAHLRGLIYIADLDCYFMAYNDKLYRKDINNQAPYLYIDTKIGHLPGKTFQYSDIHQSLFANNNGKAISVFDLKKKSETMELERVDSGGDVVDFKLYGENQSELAVLTNESHIILYKIEYKSKFGYMDCNHKIQSSYELDEHGVSLVVCPKNEYIFLETGLEAEGKTVSSQLLIFKIAYPNIGLKACLKGDRLSGCKADLGFFDYVGSHIIWLGLIQGENGVVEFYDFDTETEELKKIKEKEVFHMELDPVKLHLRDNQFYYTGKN